LVKWAELHVGLVIRLDSLLAGVDFALHKLYTK